MESPLPPRLRVLYPFVPYVTECEGPRLSRVDEGGGGATVVMLHGNPTWSSFFRDMFLALRGDFRCVAPDHLGCGLSDKPQRADYTLAGHIRRTVAVLEAAEVADFHLVVHDWGGAIGFGVARELGERVRSITVLNTAAFPYTRLPFRIAVCRWPLLGTLLVRGLNGFVEAATRMTTVRSLPPAVADGYRFPYPDWRSRVGVNAFVKDIPMGQRHRSWPTLMQIEESLADWKTRPLQILWGRRDWCFHDGILAEWQRRFPDAPVHEFPEAGHYLLEDAGEEVVSEVRAFVRLKGRNVVANGR